MAEDSTVAPVEELFITAADGVKLAATLYRPTVEDNGVAILLNSSMATPRQYYRNFCTHMAGLGFSILTYDYRGVGGSIYQVPPAPVRTVAVWGSTDQTAAADCLLQRFPRHVPMLVAHSLGGQILGLTPHAGVWRAIQLVVTAHGHWAMWPKRERPRMWLRAFVKPYLLALAPPALRERWSGSNMPYAVSHEMSVYLRTPWFFVDRQGQPVRPYNELLRAPLRHITLSDDEVVPPGSEINVPMSYPNAAFTPDPRTPADFRLEKVGHFGFFRRFMPTSAWDEVGQWLLSHK